MAEVELPITGKVAEILDRYTLVINRGSERGVKVGMIFAVIGLGGEIIDPETNKPLGPKPIEKLRVKVTDVYEKFCVAETYRIVTPARLQDLLGPSSIKNIVGELGGVPATLRVPEREWVAGAPDPREPTSTSPVVDIKVGDSVRQLVR